MKKYFLKIFLMLLLCSSTASAQWSLKTNTEDGKYSLAANSTTFFGLSGGKIQTEAVFALMPGDTAAWRLVSNTDNGLYSLAENKTIFMGIDSGKIKTKAVYILNPPTLTSLGLDTTKLAYLNKSNSFIGRMQAFDTVNATVGYLLNGVSINTAGTLSNVAYKNQANSFIGRMQTFDTVNATAGYLLNGVSINTGGTLSNVAYKNQANSFIGRMQTFDTINATVRYLLNGTNINNSGTLTNVAYLSQTNSFTGNMGVSAPTLTGSTATPIFDISQTWNTSGAPTAFKMNITNTAANSSSLLMDLQVGGATQFSISKDGAATLLGALSLSQVQSRNTSVTLKIRGGAGSTSFSGVSIDPLAASVNTSGTQSTLEITNNSNFTPSSGTGSFSAFLISTGVNQTGGANGITRGIYINPTITSAADWRAIETTSGSLVMNDSYLSGSGSLAGPLINLSQTWNTTGAPTMFKMNVTNTASSVFSLLMDLQLNGSSVFSVKRDGKVTASTITSVSDIIAGANNGISWSGRGGLGSGSASNVYAYGTSFNCFGLGGLTSSYPGLSPSTGGSLKLMLADLSGYTKTIGADFVHDDSSKGVVLKDTNGHYWRVTISTGGTLSTTDLGTSLTGF